MSENSSNSTAEAAVEAKAVQKKPLTRFGEFELLKALAILGLPAVHLMEEALEEGFAGPGLLKFGTGIIGLCAFGPSVFMICMGFGIGGGRTSPKHIRANGIQFLLIGALLNIFRWLIPGIIKASVLHTSLIDDLEVCLQSDIYYFTGLYFILYSFLKQWNIKTPGVVMTSVLMLTANTLLTPFTSAYIHDETLVSLVGNNGIKLSGGQRQRVSIARALLKNAPILVLDEATSALDSENEMLIQKSMKRAMDGKTTLVIAHRLATLGNMDRIVVIKDGKIIETGTHNQLMRQGGEYSKLWRIQTRKK